MARQTSLVLFLILSTPLFGCSELYDKLKRWMNTPQVASDGNGGYMVVVPGGTQLNFDPRPDGKYDVTRREKMRDGTIAYSSYVSDGPPVSHEIIAEKNRSTRIISPGWKDLLTEKIQVLKNDHGLPDAEFERVVARAKAAAPSNDKVASFLSFYLALMGSPKIKETCARGKTVMGFSKEEMLELLDGKKENNQTIPPGAGLVIELLEGVNYCAKHGLTTDAERVRAELRQFIENELYQ